MDLSYIRDHKSVLLDCISGSKAYGLDIATSDTDKRGLFYLPRERFFASENYDSCSNATNDESYTELGKFFELLSKANPTMIELLSTKGEVMVWRKDREFLLKIRAGVYEYADLIKMAEDKCVQIKEAFLKSSLPKNPDAGKLKELLVAFREELYVD